MLALLIACSGGEVVQPDTEPDDSEAVQTAGSDTEPDDTEPDHTEPDDTEPQDADCPLMRWYIDQDGDGYGDADDLQRGGCEAPTDRVREDGDCDDADAGVSPAGVESCADGVDNDCDDLADCEDDDCDGGCAEDCHDGRDNDGDGLTDCEDGDCGVEVCTEIDCDDGIDNDGDGTTDCLDDACWGTGTCVVVTTRIRSATGSLQRWQLHSETSWVDGAHREVHWDKSQFQPFYLVGTAAIIDASSTVSCDFSMFRSRKLSTSTWTRTTSAGGGTTFTGSAGLATSQRHFGLDTTGACGMRTWSWLPTTFHTVSSVGRPWQYVLLEDKSIPWYVGSTSTRTSTANTLVWSAASYTRTIVDRSTVYSFTLQPAGTFAFEP